MRSRTASTVCISSWQRVAPNTIPSGAKAGGNYLSSTLVSLEARDRGFDEGIALSADGTVSEGAGENLFLVKDGVIITPPATASILTGITRDSVMTLAGELGLEVREQSIPREMLYIADEIFLTGTAAEITPVRSVDRIEIGDGRRGPVTGQLQERLFFGLFNGQTQDQAGAGWNRSAMRRRPKSNRLIGARQTGARRRCPGNPSRSDIPE